MPAYQRARQFAWALVGLAFVSKISFAFTGVVPSSLGFLIFQCGIHPYLNVALNLLFGSCLLYFVYHSPLILRLGRFHSLYAAFAIGTAVILWIQHFLQLLLGIEANTFLVLITMGTCSFLIAIFGLVIPQIIDSKEFVRGLAKICFLICAISIVLLFAGAPAMYKGSRFIGIFKHIPYMVTCSTVGFIFNLSNWSVDLPLRRKAGFAAAQLLMLYCMYLTGTRSALFAAILALSIFFLAYRTPSFSFRMARVLAVWLLLVGGLLFGAIAVNFGKDLLTGKTALGNRAPQDGVSDRLDEVYRGLSMLEKSPHVGLGLLSKFSSADSDEVVDSYNSFQDPHNLFISSSVVGGWPFGVWVFLGFLALGAGALVAILRREDPALTLGIYLLSHIPILAIYHMHLSLGGMADRLYWLSFGYLGIFLAGKNAPEKMRKNYPDSITN